MDKKELIVFEAEEMIARIRLNIASGKKRLANLQFEKEELEKSFPQWDQECEKYRLEIEQIKNSNEVKDK